MMDKFTDSANRCGFTQMAGTEKGGVSEEALALNLQQRERVDPQTGCTVVVPALVRNNTKSTMLKVGVYRSMYQFT